jgi:hypothetical protein
VFEYPRKSAKINFQHTWNSNCPDVIKATQSKPYNQNLIKTDTSKQKWVKFTPFDQESRNISQPFKGSKQKQMSLKLLIS